MNRYQSGIRSAIRGLWTGELTWLDSADSMVLTIQNNYTRAWEEGLGECGIRLSEQTPEEYARLQFEINSEIQYVYGFVDDVHQNSRANGGKLRNHFARADMWTNKYSSIRDLARTYACADQKLKWVVGYTKEHCSDCLRLNNRVYRSSTWRNVDLYPKKHSLECGGFHCACEFISTDEPCTPGFPPSL